MNKKDMIAWTEKTKRLNENQSIKIGMSVKDVYGNKGVVVKIIIPEDISVENHGTIYVWQSERYEYGADNCEHYTFINWQNVLRIEDFNIHNE